MAVKMGTFNGASVFLSRNLVPPEMFDALHDALRLNGAQVFLCCDPSRNAPNDYHVIATPDHEKFADLRAKGCNLLGPHCVLSCAKERRVLPKQVYTCCLAMDGVRVLASGFEKDEKVKIEELVTAMGGTLLNKAALDVNFVVAKNVLAAKYKWALYILKKPTVSINWLQQCWAEHRVVPQEPYRILPFAGLTICVTGIPADEREEMRTLVIQNGGKYSADLTKKCTHLISDAPEGDKYKVAQKWGSIHTVSRKWFEQSIARKACLDESHYPVRQVSAPSSNMKNGTREQYIQDQSIMMSEATTSTDFADIDNSTSQNISSNFSDSSKIISEDRDFVLNESVDEPKFACNVAKDSEDEDCDLYLSDCRILAIGFEDKDLRRLVNMIRKGGGTRHMLLSEKLTHIIVGAPSETEKKEVRRLAAYGVINVVKTAWLEDCDMMKKEVPVSQRHIACDLLLPKDAGLSNKTSSAIVSEAKNVRNLTALPHIPASQVHFDKSNKEGYPLEKSFQTEMVEVIAKDKNLSFSTSRSSRGNVESIDVSRLQSNSNASGTQRKPENVFKGMRLCFSDTFPKDKRAEIEEWITQGGGLIVTHPKNVQYVIESHGAKQRFNDTSSCQSTMVSSHWIRFCLQEGRLLDVGSHVLFSPLPCNIPLAGFEGTRFCISQYEDKERLLLKNLCFTLGAKFTEKLTKRVTHLLCKFANGPKYEAACMWGIQSVTAEWVNECIKQDRMVPMDRFRPRAATAQDSDAGLCITSQYPTQAARMISVDVPSQLGTRSSARAEESGSFRSLDKRRKYSEEDPGDDPSPANGADLNRGSNNVSDVADAIEDLLAQSNKDMKTAEEKGCRQSVYSPGDLIVGQDPVNSSSSFPMSDRRRLNRFDEELGASDPPSAHERSDGNLDVFSETQTESQVVWYEEDLSGRQKIIERARSQSMASTPEPK